MKMSGSDVRRTPWEYWSPHTRETVCWYLEQEMERTAKLMPSVPWSRFPISRGQIEDTIRGLEDLLGLIRGGAGASADEGASDVESVGMGEEAAP